jgi:hypothetical protein
VIFEEYFLKNRESQCSLPEFEKVISDFLKF